MTTTVAAIATTILAIDLGKYKSVACEYVAATGEVVFRAFDTATRTPIPQSCLAPPRLRPRDERPTIEPSRHRPQRGSRKDKPSAQLRRKG